MALSCSLVEICVFSMLLRRFAIVAKGSSLSLPEVEVVSNLFEIKFNDENLLSIKIDYICVHLFKTDYY